MATVALAARRDFKDQRFYSNCNILLLGLVSHRKCDMRKIFLSLLFAVWIKADAQIPKTPCTTNPVYRQFDFWVGNWEAYGLNGKKAGDSKIELILDSCIVLENWTSAAGGYTGKSFNTFN